MRKKIVIALLSLFSMEIQAQNNGPLIIFAENYDSIMALVKPHYKWLGTEGQMVADDMKLKYRKPKGFRHKPSIECFNDHPKLKSTFTCMSHQIHSDDGQMIVFLTFTIFSKELQNEINELFPQHATELVDKQHRWQMRGIMTKYYGEGIGESWHDSITVYSGAEARRKFNADSAFTFTLHLRPADYYKKDFKHVKVLLIQRMGRGYAYICSFYTDKAITKFDKYWRRIEKTLRYKD